jgi:pyruvate,water dikinase
MEAFEKINSGLAGLDSILDGIRIGDNVVWQVGLVDDYRTIAGHFAEQAIADRRRLIYIRFAPHTPILEEREGLTIHRLDPFLGFENFTGEVHRIVAEAGKEAFYIFDCLSELETAWAADLMMGNFFTVTCPYLFELDTVAWFCLLRHRHSYDTIARIRETTQILLDLYPDESCYYIHPIKVWKRYSPTMFFPHRLCLANPHEVSPLTDGVSVSRFYRIAGIPGDTGGERDLDSWERFFIKARKTAAENPPASAALVRPMAERLIGSEDRFLDLILQNCTAADLLELKDRMIGSGKIGGKAAGMILSRKIVRNSLPELSPRIEPHDSFFVGSDVFYTYLVHNRLWKMRILQRTKDGYFRESSALRDGILAGAFPDRIREQFLRTLEYFGQTPIIVRSSSLLEDSFGHAFAGKYESVFCVNTGSPEDRLKAFEDAMRLVYASTMDTSALAYRQQRGLQDQDEQMAILVQRVSGSLFGDYFMPAVAGVGYSFNTWRWHRELDPRAGMIQRLSAAGKPRQAGTGSCRGRRPRHVLPAFGRQPRPREAVPRDEFAR